ncbi:MAG: hypothetical protein LC745_08400 [Planctomycetia bacterium]|nr:hypothetical protein [Planctomycetia bacterium]
MPRYSFPGYHAFLEDAAQRIGHPEAEGPARKAAALSALGNLCAQAGTADPEHVPGILAKAGEFRDQLRAASLAADLMLSDVERALGLQEDKAPEKKAARPPRAPESKDKRS